jgi:hypothetical protein
MNQNVATYNHIKRSLVPIGSRFFVRVFRSLCTLACGNQDVGVSIEANYRAARSDDIGGKHCHVAGAAAKIKHPHSRRKTCLAHQTHRDRANDLRLEHKTLHFVS